MLQAQIDSRTSRKPREGYHIGRFKKNLFVDDPLQPGSHELLELQERLAGDDHVQAVEQFIAKTDHQALYQAYRGTGSKPYRPERLLAIVIVLIL